MPTLAGLFLLGLILGIAPVSGAANLSEEQFEKGKFIYFDRCSGCHGTLRKGATGPIITDEEMLKKELPELEEVLFEGTDAGMPGWGRTGELTEEEIKAGTEVWASVWDRQGEIVIYDDKTLKEIRRITGDWIVTPRGKWNVYNTVHDIY